MSRDFSTTIKEILAVVPATESAFRAALSRVERNSRYYAPETMRRAWAEAAEVFFAKFGATLPTDGWQAKAVAILRGQR